MRCCKKFSFDLYVSSKCEMLKKCRTMSAELLIQIDVKFKHLAQIMPPVPLFGFQILWADEWRLKQSVYLGFSTYMAQKKLFTFPLCDFN